MLRYLQVDYWIFKKCRLIDYKQRKPLGFNSGFVFSNQKRYPIKKFKFGNHEMWFPKGNKIHFKKLTKKWFNLYKVHNPTSQTRC